MFETFDELFQCGIFLSASKRDRRSARCYIIEIHNPLLDSPFYCWLSVTRALALPSPSLSLVRNLAQASCNLKSLPLSGPADGLCSPSVLVVVQTTRANPGTSTGF
jgi:hypothetical protein